MSVPTIETEVQLAGWKISHTDGAKITFWLPDESALEPFRTLTARAGSKSGQRLMAVFVLIDDEEQPVAIEKPKGGALSVLAGRWCNDERFQAWLRDKEPNLWGEVATYHVAGGLDETPETARDVASEVVREICEIESRAELDHDPEAAKRFHELVRDPYKAHLAAK